MSEELQQTMFGISQKAYEAVQKDGAQSANSENASTDNSSSDKIMMMMLLMLNIQKNNRISNSIYYKAKEDRFYICPLFEYIEFK